MTREFAQQLLDVLAQEPVGAAQPWPTIHTAEHSAPPDSFYSADQ